MEKQLLSKKQLADHLQVSEVTIDRWRKQGMPWTKAGVKLIRFDLEQVNDWLQSRERNDFAIANNR